MRPARALVVLVGSLLLAIGCSCGNSHERDAGAAEDAARSDAELDGAPGDGEVDAASDAGAPDPATCEGFAAAVCALYAGCYAEVIYLLGSLERCEASYRAACEHADTLERTGDLTAARIAYVEARDTVDCTWANDDAAWPAPYPPPGIGVEGDPCRASLQCGESMTADGRTVRMHCLLPSDVTREPACDIGVCEIPLPEGTPDCVHELIERCDVTAGLECGYVPDDSTPRCVPRSRLADGEPCDRMVLSAQCDDGSVCGPTSVCERQRFNGEGCDPATRRHCAGGDLVACDPESRTCVLPDLAFEGEACGPPGDAICGGLQVCTDGTCVRRDGFGIRGEACEGATDCWYPLTCTDGACAGEPCE